MAFRAICLTGILSSLVCAQNAGTQRIDLASDSSPDLPMPRARAEVVLPASTGPDLLEVRSANEQLYTDLESFVCDEQIARYEGRLSGEKAHHIDTVTAKVSFENGVEQYTEVRQNNRRRASISSITGAWSENEYGTLLRQTQLLLTTQRVQFLRASDLDGTPAAVYAFEVSEQDTPWDLEVGAHHYKIPFRTEVWVSRDSGRILQLERTSTHLSAETGISQLSWSVLLAPVEINGRSWLLPKTAAYAVNYDEFGRREWNEMIFSNYRRYGSEVALRFDDMK
jgi:hypothetical protein